MTLQGYLYKTPEAKKAEFKELAQAAMREERAKEKKLRAKAEKIRNDAKPMQDAYSKAQEEFHEWTKKARKEYALSNPNRKAWLQLGDKFNNIFDFTTSEGKSFKRISSQAAKGNYDSWSWLKDSKIAGKNGAADDEEEPPDIPMF